MPRHKKAGYTAKTARIKTTMTIIHNFDNTTRPATAPKFMAPGQKYNGLTILSLDNHLAYCRCDCGRELQRNKYAVYDGRTKSCGCTARAACSNTKKVHGLTNTLTFRSWVRMYDAYRNTNSRQYYTHGARFEFYEPWKTFQQFLKDMGESPSDKHILARIDQSKPHSPENCEWSTKRKGKTIKGVATFDMPESKIQRTVVSMLHLNKIFVFHVPNGGYRPKLSAAHMKSAGGIVSGMTDLVIINRGILYCLELKTKIGRLSKSQKTTIELLKSVGANVEVAYGLDDAIAILVAWGLLPEHYLSKASQS